MSVVGETELDTRALFRALWRGSWLLILLAALAAGGTYYLLGKVEPLYSADTSILIEERESPLTRARDGAAVPDASFDESAIQSQVEVLRSREIADLVIDRLNLTRRQDFDPAAKPSLVSSLKVMLGLQTPPTLATIRQRVMDSYYERLTVYPVGKSRVITVQFQAPDPQLAAEVANAVAEAFVDLQQDAKRESAVAATSWLEQEIERLRDRVAEAEQAVASYRAGNELYAVGTGADPAARGNLSTQQLSDLNAELARARAARAEAEARAQQVQSVLAEGGALESAQEVLDSPLIQRLRERQVGLRAQIVELSTTYLPGHPRIRSLQSQLSNLEGQIRQEAEKTLNALRTAARVAAAREQSLMASLDQAKVAVSQSNDQEIELRALEREAAAQRDLLESFLARYREALARTDADYLPADARIISRAVAPQNPSFPKKTMMAAAAGIAAFLLGAAILLLREFGSGRAFRVIQYGALAAPALAAARLEGDEPMPPAALVPAPVAAADPAEADGSDLAAAEDDRQADLFETPAIAPAAALAAGGGLVDVPGTGGLAFGGSRPSIAELGAMLADPANRLVLFAGAQGGEGAGDLAFAAARAATGDKLRLVLLDIGMTPSDALGGRERPGLGDLLTGEASFGEVIRRDEASRVHTIPMGGTDGNPPLQRLQIVIGALSHTYDKVIVVAESLDDWPDEHVRPDLAALVCDPETSEEFIADMREAVLRRGARQAQVVFYAGKAPDRFGEGTVAA